MYDHFFYCQKFKRNKSTLKLGWNTVMFQRYDLVLFTQCFDARKKSSIYNVFRS